MRKTFDEVFEDRTKYGTKVKTDEYKECGAHIIIDQGQEQIAGYTDLEEGLLEEVPAIIFGDHTRVIKYVDEPFFLGADGVKVLRSKYENANYKYLYYALKNANIPNTGYNRHFKWLKEVAIEYPDMDKQAEIVDILDRVTAVIEARQQELKKLDELVKARFVEMFEGKQWQSVSAGSIMHSMRNGMSPSNKGTITERVLTLSAITHGQFDATAWKDGLFDECPPKDKRISKSDFYMCRGNGNKDLVGTGVYSSTDMPTLVFPDTVIAASVDEGNICLPFLHYEWKQPAVRRQIEAGARTTNGTYKVNQKVLSGVEIILPPLALQRQFSDFVAQLDKSKVVVQKALDEAQLLFDSLMQQYFG